MLARYAKAVTALVGAVGTALIAGLADGDMSLADWLAVLAAAATALGVGVVRNRPDAQSEPTVRDLP